MSARAAANIGHRLVLNISIAQESAEHNFVQREHQVVRLRIITGRPKVISFRRAFLYNGLVKNTAVNVVFNSWDQGPESLLTVTVAMYTRLPMLFFIYQATSGIFGA